MPLRQVACTDEFFAEYDEEFSAFASTTPDPWLDVLSAFTTTRPLVRFIITLCPMSLLGICLLISFSKKIDSFGLKIFCWNCCFVNATLAIFLGVRYFLLDYYYKVNDICYYNNKRPTVIGKANVPYALESPKFTEEVVKWTIYSTGVSFLFLRYSAFRACIAPLAFKRTFSKRWWLAVVIVSDLLPFVIIPLSSEYCGLTCDECAVSIHFKVRTALIIGFAGAFWLSECGITLLSLITIVRFLRRRRRTSELAPDDSKIIRLASFTFFSIVPCLQMVPSVITSVDGAMRDLGVDAMIECFQQNGVDSLDDISDTNYDELSASCDLGSADTGLSSTWSQTLLSVLELFCLLKPYIEALMILFLLPSYRAVWLAHLRRVLRLSSAETRQSSVITIKLSSR
ncbi:hypothetical protein AAVH_21685 [Aphelenchoides avenae]|nr:hypothetical protein AAVH_21685 [Aphelenchus avenae]